MDTSPPTMLRLHAGLLWLSLAVLAAVVFSSPEDETPYADRASYAALNERLRSLESRLDDARVGTAAVRPASTPDAATRDLVSRLHALEQLLAQRQTAAAGVVPAAERDTDPVEGDIGGTLFTAQLAQAGVDAAGLGHEDFRRAPADIWHAGTRLTETFEQLPLAAHGRISDMACYHSHCDISLRFDEARAAVEQEAQLMSWLATADGGCSFELKPVDLTDGQVAATRRASIRCG